MTDRDPKIEIPKDRPETEGDAGGGDIYGNPIKDTRREPDSKELNNVQTIP